MPAFKSLQGYKEEKELDFLPEAGAVKIGAIGGCWGEFSIGIYLEAIGSEEWITGGVQAEPG